ncbi:MAG: zinc-ribbon domain-containing protein [Alphaproteobacteria bacterium]|nr:zinc-ribbon domain-containing protein [Alphaproteobacteria bacterium]
MDTDLLHRHNGSYELPRYYVDLRFSCRDCGRSEVWTAEQQKWWYEVCHESIHRKERRCRACRDAHRQRLAALPPGANLLGEERDRLRALAEKPPTPESLTAIEAALQSKWWSLRIVAIQTLGHWGGPDQIRQLEDLVTAGNACRQTCGKEWLRLFAEISSEKRNCDSSRASPCWASTCWAAVAADAATKALRLHALSSAGDSSATDPAQHPTHRSPHHKA